MHPILSFCVELLFGAVSLCYMSAWIFFYYGKLNICISIRMLLVANDSTQNDLSNEKNLLTPGTGESRCRENFSTGVT